MIGELTHLRSANMPRAATMPSPVCHTSLLTANMRLSRLADSFRHASLVSTAGAWEAGVDGALPGIVMLAEPEVGEAYRQEFYPGEAEDMGKVVEVGVTRQVGDDEYDDVVVTIDWTPLEPDVVEEKGYAPGIGLIYETKVAGDEGLSELIEFTPGETS